MWGIQSHNKELYSGLFIATLFLSIASMGSGLFSDSSNTLISWQHNIFKVLCHQDPARSFSVSGIKMAVCSRCFGIYSALLVGTLIMPLYSLLSGSTINTEKNWLIAAILLNLADVSGNYFGLWTNTMFSRFILGCVVGLPVILILTNDFFTINKSE